MATATIPIAVERYKRPEISCTKPSPTDSIAPSYQIPYSASFRKRKCSHNRCNSDHLAQLKSGLRYGTCSSHLKPGDASHDITGESLLARTSFCRTTMVRVIKTKVMFFQRPIGLIRFGYICEGLLPHQTDSFAAAPCRDERSFRTESLPLHRPPSCQSVEGYLVPIPEHLQKICAPMLSPFAKTFNPEPTLAGAFHIERKPFSPGFARAKFPVTNAQ